MMSPSDYPFLQAEVGAWHKAKFPLATAVEIGLKATEELGETASEILIDFSNNTAKFNEITHAPQEAADVLISLFALIERFYPGYDLLTEVDKKLSILTDPNSGHRAAIAVV